MIRAGAGVGPRGAAVPGDGDAAAALEIQAVVYLQAPAWLLGARAGTLIKWKSVAKQALLEENRDGRCHIQAKGTEQGLGILCQMVIHADGDLCHSINPIQW